MAHEAAMSEEMAMKAMMDAARLAEELRTEQEVAMTTERDRKLLEAQVKDLVARCDEAETNALKVCKQHMTTRQSILGSVCHIKHELKRVLRES